MEKVGLVYYTMLSASKAKSLYEVAVEAKKIDGEFWDVGCNAGGSSAIFKIAAPRKKVRMFDSFEGLPEAVSKDGRDNEPNRFTAKYDENLWILGEVYKGWIPETFKGLEDKKISLAHIDLDLYEGTRDALQFIMPRMNIGGYIVVDDYNSDWKGVTVAVDEAITDKFEKLPVVQDQIVFRRLP